MWIALFLKVRDLKKKMGKAAREKLEREYSLDSHCTKMMEIYSEFIVK